MENLNPVVVTVSAMAAAAAGRGEVVFATPAPDLPIRHHKHPSPCDVSLLDTFDKETSSPTGPKRELNTFDNVTLVAPDASRHGTARHKI